MAWAPETDRHPILVPVGQIGQLYDAALDGEPILLDWEGVGGFAGTFGSQDAVGYEQASEETGIEQTSTSDDIAENKLTAFEFWRSTRDFRGGLGQRRFDVPEVSTPNAYFESLRVDSRRPGELKLARKTTTAAPATFAPGNLNASDQGSDGFWFISQSGSGSTMAVTHYDFTTFTTKTLATTSWFRDVAVGPDDKCWIGGDNGLYYVTKAGSITAWTSTAFQVRRICVAKHRIFMGAFQTGDPSWSLWEIDVTGTPPVAPTKKLALAPGLVPQDVKEAGALVLFAVNPYNYEVGVTAVTGAGRLYAYDGVNAPTTVLVLSPGEQLTCIHPILGGAQVLLFVRRLEANGNIRGVLYLADINGTQLQNARIVFEYPTSYSAHYVNEAVGLGQQVYFPGAYDASRSAGIGIDAYNIVTGTVAHNVVPPSLDSSNIYQLTSYNGRLVWSQTQSAAMKLVIESNTDYEANGNIDSSVIDLNVDAPKLFTKIEVGCEPLAASQKIEVYWTADDFAAGDWRLAGVLHPGQASQIFPVNKQASKIALRAKLYGTATTTPTLTKLGVAAQMARLPQLVHQLKVLAFPDMHRLDGQRFEPSSERYFWSQCEWLEGLRAAGRPVWFQSPLSRIDGHCHKVKVGQVAKRMLNHPDRGFGGQVAVRLRNVEPDRRNLLPLAVSSLGALPTLLDPTRVFETVGSATAATRDSTNTSWVNGPKGGFTKANPTAVGGGIRGPAPHLQVPWDALDRRGQSASACVLVRPFADNMRFTLVVEAFDAADALVQTNTSDDLVLTTGTSGLWHALMLEDFNYDTRDVLLFLVITVKLAASSAVASFGWDGGQLEQSRICTPLVLPPSNV